MQDENTYIKIFRKMLNWGWYKDANTFRVFMHILLRVNYEPSEYMGQKIGAGECVFGRKTWAKELGLSERQVRTAIEHLKSTNEIATKSTNRFTIITVVNWEFWQIEEGLPTKQTTNKKSNKRPHLKNNNISSSLRSEDIYRGLPKKLVETLKAFEDMRKSINKPLKTDHARKLLLNKLKELAGDNTDLKIEIINQSILNSWQSVYPIKRSNGNGTKYDIGNSTKEYAGLAESIPESKEKVFKFKEA